MTAQIRNLAVLTYAQGHTQWVYRTTERVSTVCVENYFQAFSDMLAFNDIITLLCSDGVAMRYVVGVAPGHLVLGNLL